MYIVKWDDHEGNRHEQEFTRGYIARVKAVALEKTAWNVELYLREHLYEVDIQSKRTGDKINLYAWAENTNYVTRYLSIALFGADGEYEWLGTSPVYKDNQLVTREVKL